MNLIEEFTQWLMEDGKAKKTIESYTTDIKKFEEYRLNHSSNSADLLSRFLIIRYKQHIQEQGLKVATINKKINSLKVYNDFLQIKGYVKDNYIQLKKDKVVIASGSEHTVTALTEEEVERFLFYLEDKEKVSERNRLIGYLLLYTGVRVSELVGIRLEDISLMPPTIMIKGKGGKIREISLRQDVLTYLKEYLQGEREKSPFSSSPYLLVSKSLGARYQNNSENNLQMKSLISSEVEDFLSDNL